MLAAQVMKSVVSFIGGLFRWRGVEVLKFDHEWSVNSASFSLDGHLLVTASDDLAQTIGR